MLTENLTLKDLFLQLGLPKDQQKIDSFINQHNGLDENIRIENASFWTESQAAFLRTSLEEDAEWAELIDQLSAMLR